MNTPDIVIFWFRRDLRITDNHGLYLALSSGRPVLPLFIFDPAILNPLPSRKDARVDFILNALHGLQKEISGTASSLLVEHGNPVEVFREIISNYSVRCVYANHDYEPYAIRRDEDVKNLLYTNGIRFETYNDQVFFEKSDVIKDNGLPYTIFTPYSRKWKSRFAGAVFYPSETLLGNFLPCSPFDIPSHEMLGFIPSGSSFPGKSVDDVTIIEYQRLRDYPAKNGTTRLGVHLRFGTISIRQLVSKAASLSETFLNELIWREFYMMILWHFPQVVTQSFKPEYDRLEWLNNEAHFEAWTSGSTGYPIVDAGMHELNQTGYMHNRVRMITASFLCKHLLIDWRLGEAYFASRLLDYELASNNGGWQWAAGTGVDAAPYFRIFNPMLQTARFDPDQAYIRRWLPEIQSPDYPKPIVEHTFARQRALAAYKNALR